MLYCIATTLEKISRSPVIPGRPVELPAGSPSLRGRRGSEDPREGSRPAGGQGSWRWGRVPGGGKGREEGGWRDVAGLGRPK